MFGISMWEVALILLVALIVLGPRQLTETAQVIGRLYRELQRMTSDVRNTIDLESIGSLSDSQRSGPPQKLQATENVKLDQDLVPPPGEKSGPDFYADLLEKSEEPAEAKEIEAEALGGIASLPEQEKDNRVNELKM